MTSWQKANTSAFIPPALNAVIDTAQSVSSAAVMILDAIKTAVDVVKNFILAYPVFDWASALGVAIEKFKNDFLATGLYMLNMWDYPLYQYNRSGGVVIAETFDSSFEYDLTEAFYDQYDTNRPPFSSEVAALILVVAVPGIEAITNIMKVQKEAFSWWNEVSDVYDRLTRISMEVEVKSVIAAIKSGDILFSKNPSEQTINLLAVNVALQQAKDDLALESFEQNIKPYIPTVTSTPKQVLKFVNAVQTEVAKQIPPYPNFQQTSLRTIVPALPQVFDEALNPLLAALASGSSIQDTLEALIDTIQSKIDALDDIVNSINLILTQVDNLVNNTALYALFVSSMNGIDGLTDEIRNAENKPLAGSGGYYAGILILAGGPGITPFKNLFGPIGS